MRKASSTNHARVLQRIDEVWYFITWDLRAEQWVAIKVLVIHVYESITIRLRSTECLGVLSN